MKCDKQKEGLEGEVSVLKSENEALKKDAIKQDKELSTAVAALKLRDEQYAAADQKLGKQVWKLMSSMMDVQAWKSKKVEKENAAKEAEIEKKEEENAKLIYKVQELLKDKELANEKQVNEVIALQKQLEQIGTEKAHIMDLMAGVERKLLWMTNH
ncbi:hypothetical protein EMCRGX_G007290 [Ephydatia muelleri]